MNLEAEVLKKFEPGLRKRFDLRRVKREVTAQRLLGVKVLGGRAICIIKASCELCDAYYAKTISTNYCEGCPFAKNSYSVCITWMRRILRLPLLGPLPFQVNKETVWWHASADSKARKAIKLLKKRAGKLITFV